MDDSALAIWHQVLGWQPEVTWYLGVFAMVFPLEVLFGSNSRATWSERFGNLSAMLIYFLIGGLVLNLSLMTPIGQWLSAFPREPRHPLLRNAYVWALTYVFLVDAAYYGYHRLQHAVPLFWRIHKLHHTDPAMNITTARRTHFLERALQYLCLSIPILWALGMHLEGMTYATLVTWIFVYAGHADVRLEIGFLTPIWVGPFYHRLHHSRLPEHRDVNFAQVFPVFDIIGGTYRRPRWDEYPATGVDGCNTPYERWRPLVW
jgi:sterol desaturase/sphingolipid hydroxylase (fatty acid hydroxylase superfamily)